jgi:hypothetical protein
MGLIINATDKRVINLRGGSSLSSVYARINFKAYPDGETLEIGLDIYLSKDKYIEGVIIFTDVPDNNFFVQIDTISESQSLDYAHVYAVQYFEDMGYYCQVV